MRSGGSTSVAFAKTQLFARAVVRHFLWEIVSGGSEVGGDGDVSGGGDVGGSGDVEGDVGRDGDVEGDVGGGGINRGFDSVVNKQKKNMMDVIFLHFHQNY